jgi:hypothetical protein
MKRYYVREKGKYKAVKLYDFPTRPMDGYWIVQGNRRGWVCRVSDLPKYDTKAFQILTTREDGLATLMLEAKMLSAHNQATLAIAYLSAVKEWTRKEIEEAVASTKRRGYYEAS